MFGGAITKGTIAKEQLYKLRIDGNKAQWTEIQVTGSKPGPRYGHSLAFSKPFVILFGGSTGSGAINETWLLNIKKKILSWSKLKTNGNIPSPRIYHSTGLCRFGGAAGMIIIFGGREGSGKVLNDIWGLRRHKNGKWSWTKPPNKNDAVQPLGSYQHTSLFFGSFMLNIGGLSNDKICNKIISIYDFELNKWYTADGIECFRHVCWIYKNHLKIHGGLIRKDLILNGQDTVTLDIIEMFKDYPDLTTKMKRFINIFSLNISPLSSQNNSQSNSPLFSPNTSRRSSLNQASNNETDIEICESKVEDKKEPIEVVLPKEQHMDAEANNNLCNFFIKKLLKPKTYTNLPPEAKFMFTKEKIINICDQAEEIIKSQPILVRTESPVTIFGDIHGQYSDLMRFFDLWGAPCNPEEDELDKEDDYSYVFLGDYVDRGNHSLETICLLIALKVKFPNKITLLRGNHEDKRVNKKYGFIVECEQRLGENPSLPDSVYNRINNLFEYLPLACIIDDTILCLHGGIGSSLKKIEQIETIERPLKVEHKIKTALEKLVIDILWSDPTSHDGKLGLQPNNVRDPSGKSNIVKFGPDVVKEFLQRNKLSKIIRAHECVMDGFERFAGGNLFTVFSATDYCGKHKNAGAILIITKSYGISPKLVYPNMQQLNWIDEGEAGYRPPTPPRWHGNPFANY